jgi:hypothetical protein
MGKQPKSAVRSSPKAASRPFPKDYFASSEKSPARQGGDDLDAVYRAVGRTLSIWEGVEGSMASMYSIACDVHYLHASVMLKRTFGFIETNSGRRSALVNMLRLYLVEYQDIGPEVRKLINCINELLKNAGYLRNEIAHGIAMSFPFKAVRRPPGSEEGMIGCYLVAPEYVTSRNDLTVNPIEDPRWSITSSYCCTPNEIDALASKFEQLKTYLDEKVALLKKDDALKIPMLIAQIREMKASV